VALPKGLEVEGVILSDQVKNLDFVAREITYICEAPKEVLVNVQKNVLALVG
jgi:mRNA interferase MazF